MWSMIKCGQCGQLGWKSRKDNCLLLRKRGVLHISFHADQKWIILTDWQGQWSLNVKPS